jgi:hypothetical protein
VWVTGFGDFVNVDADANAKGYDFTTGGVSLGVDYRITDQLANRCDGRIRAYVDRAHAERSYRCR